MEYYDSIYQAIRNSKRVPVTAEDGMLVIKVIEAALKSNVEKRVIEV
jgi:predicted dehydrogenase